MARKLSVAAAIIVLTASWAWADGFRVIADAPPPPTPLYVSPGAVVKAEFSTAKAVNVPEAGEDDRTMVEAASPAGGTQVKPRPAVAFRERPTGSMAPPPPPSSMKDQPTEVAAGTEDGGLEADLEKDLVLTPAAPKAKDKPQQRRETPAQVSGQDRTVAPETKTLPKKPLQRVKKVSQPAEQTPVTTSGKPIRKVKPITQNPWQYPAGASPATPLIVEPQARTRHTGARADAVVAPRHYSARACPPDPDYVSQERPRVAEIPPGADRFVREGVTIKLAPAAAGNRGAQPEDGGDDIFSAAAEILGLPFAFISSLF